ncbi:MAG: zinc-binding dehydrogenase [Oscillospiraceae bacterium]|jgi:L-iditol 2-dehydrogenase/propanol-preferring alcohol dehydrogenase|nr:zinc-binding dehydrogenase [Oscillospiraceae bacterium]
MRGLAVDANGKLSVPQLSMPAYGPCQALVKTLSCGVCNGTDGKLIHGTFKNMHDYPMLLGHEGVGRVVEVGRNVTKYKVGDVVLLPFLYAPQDGYFSGWGAYAEYAVVGDEGAFARAGQGAGTPGYDEGCWAQSIVRPDDAVDAAGAAMVITFREVLSAMRRFGFKPNENLVVFGAGPVGLCFTRFAKLLGMGPVVTVDIFDEKTAQAARLGADITINSKKQEAEAEIRRIFPNGADNIVDAVGVNDLLNQAMRLVKYNGKICGYGISAKLDMQLDWSGGPYNWTLQFVQFPSKYEEYQAHSQVMAWINAGVLHPADYISDVIPFAQITAAFDLAEKRLPGTKKIVIAYE